MASVRQAAIKHLGPKDEATLGIYRLQAHLLESVGRPAEAVPLVMTALSGYRSTHGGNHPLVHDCT